MATITSRNGKYSVRVRVQGHGPVSRTFNDSRAAHAWASETEDAIRRGIFQAHRPCMLTLDQALSRYEREVTPGKRGADKERYVIGTLRRLSLRTRPLDQITPADLVRLRDQWRVQVSPSTIQKRHALLSHLYSTAIREWGFTDLVNPLLKVSKPRVSNQRTRIIQADELEAILACSPNAVLPQVARLAWYTAARLGELVALQWPDVDLVNRTMTFPITKNGRAREVPLVPAAVALLAALKPKSPTGPVFAASSLSMSKSWAVAVRKARLAYEQDCVRQGLEPDDDWLVDVHFHDTRHSAITRLAEHGLSTLELAAISGHRSLSMLSRYTHIRAQTLASKLASLVASA